MSEISPVTIQFQPMPQLVITPPHYDDYFFVLEDIIESGGLEYDSDIESNPSDAEDLRDIREIHERT